jgi:hypothetical protein
MRRKQVWNFAGLDKLQCHPLLSSIDGHVIECLNGCRCNATNINTHHPPGPQFSVMHLHLMHVTQSVECKLSIKVLKETISKGHKIKILGVMSSEDPISHHWVSDGAELLNGDVLAFMGRLAHRRLSVNVI